MGGGTGTDEYIDISFKAIGGWFEKKFLDITARYMIRAGNFQHLGILKGDDPRQDGESWSESIWRIHDSLSDEEKEENRRRSKIYE